MASFPDFIHSGTILYLALSRRVFLWIDQNNSRLDPRPLLEPSFCPALRCYPTKPFKQLLGRANLPLNNFFAFVNLEKFEVVFGSTGLLPNQPLALATFDTAVHQLQRTTARQQQISKFRERLQAILGIELVEYSALPELNNLADASMGMSLALLLRGQPMRADVAGFRRNTVGAFTAVLYLDDKPPLAPLSNLVSKLDNRIKQSSSSANKSCKRPIPKSTSQKSCNTNNGASKVSKLLGSEESEGGSRGLGKFKISLLPTPEPKPVLHKESAGNVDLFMSHAFIPLHGAFLQWNNFFVTPSYPLSQALTNQRLHQNIACHSAMVLHAKAVQNRTDFILTPTAWSWLLGSIAPNTHFPT